MPTSTTILFPADAASEEVRRLAEQAPQENLAMRANLNRIIAALEAAIQASAAATADLQALTRNINTQEAPTTAATKCREI